MKSLRGLCFVLLFLFSFFSCSWLIPQVDGKYWATDLTTLFLNFLISNVVLFIRSFEIFANIQNAGVDGQRRYLISHPFDVSSSGDHLRLTHV